jgi:hypothetical protein
MRNLAGDIFQIVRPRIADDDGIVQWESTGRMCGRRLWALSEAQSATSHSLL